MSLKCKLEDRNLIVEFNGELDHHNAEQARIIIDDEVRRNNVKNVIFDFTGMSFMDSSGLGLVIGRYKSISTKGGQVIVTNISDQLDRIFNISGLYQIIKKYQTLDDARAQL